MYLPATTLLSTALLILPALSAPVEDAVSMMTSSQPWIITSFTRTCNSGNTACTYYYGINTQSGSPTTCSYSVDGNNAADESYSGKKCGVFTISSNWSGQFGPGNGFTTLAINNGKELIFPAYTDKQLVNGKSVFPNKSYAPQKI